MNAQRARITAGVIGLSLLCLSIFNLVDAYSEIKISSSDQSGTPTTFIAPELTAQDRPLVLAGHGFSGSRQNLYGFALTFAKAGYPVILWDFNGHGYNKNPFPENMNSGEFQTNVANAIEFAIKNGYQADNIAIMGHSMGSGVAMTYGHNHPQTRSTIAVSPVSGNVTPTLPQNLLLMAGQLEKPFIDNAKKILEQAGGEGGSLHVGTARLLVEIPYVEHVSILFSPVAHRTALAWLNNTFGAQPGAIPYTDIRMVWWGLGILGIFLTAYAIAPISKQIIAAPINGSPRWRQLLSLIIGSFSASLILWLIGLLGISLQSSLGLLVGGYLLIWFGVSGIVSWLIIGLKPVLPSRMEILSGLIVFGLLWLGIGLLTHFVWMNWWLVPKRLVLWPVGTALLFPWFLLVGYLVQSKTFLARFVWWIGYSAIVAAGLFTAVQLDADISFLLLILPLIPFILGLHAIVSMPQRGAWPFAIGGAMWVSWAFIAVFPLQ